MKAAENRRPRPWFAPLALVLGLVAWASLASADTPPPPGVGPNGGGPDLSSTHCIHVRPASGPIRIDGILDDDAWKDAVEISDFYEFRPGDGVPSRVRTVCKLAYDADHLYMMARCYDPNPSQIRAHLTDRDHFYDDDYIGIELDTFLDHRTGYEFFTNPLGIQGDIAVSNGGNEDDSFDALWTSAARIDSLGWTAEISIPTKSIRFRNVPVTEWGFWIFRNYPRDARYQIASRKMSRDNPCWNCQFDHLDSLRNLVAGKNLEMLPYVTQSVNGTRDGASDPFQTQSDAKLGLSLKYGVTPSLTLDATVHPDFAQVESDQEQITENNQAALFLTEKRPFFLEGNAIFQGIGNWYYSRAITTPDWAGKITGRQGPYQLGLMMARDPSTQIIYPYLSGSVPLNVTDPNNHGADVPSTDLILRARRDLLQDSNVGLTATSRSYGPNGSGYNRLAALDGFFRYKQNWRWIWYVAGTRTKDLPGYVAVPAADSMFQDSTGYAAYQELWYTTRHINLDAWYTRKSAGYRSDLGYQPENDLGILETFEDLEESPAGKVVDYWQPSIYTAYQKDGRGHLVDAIFKPEFFIRLKHQWQIDTWSQIRRSRRESDAHDQFIDANRLVLAGSVQKRGSGFIVPSSNFRVGDDIILSTLRLGKSVTWTNQVDVRPSSNLLVTLSHTFYNLDDDSARMVVRQNLGLLRMTYQFTPRLFLRLLTQFVQTDAPGQHPERDLTNQFLLSYKVNYATVFFLGVNGEHYNPMYATDQPAESFTPIQRGAFAKFQYFWRY
jgi:hypothetical protein